MARRKTDIVPVETVGVGDTASFTTDDGEVITKRTGKVAVIRVLGHVRTLETENGKELASYYITRPRAVQCEMIARYEPLQPALFEV